MTSVAMVTELFLPSLGGQEFRFYRLAEGLSKRGIDVTVYTSDHTGGMLSKEEYIGKVHVIRYIKLKKYVKPGSRSFSQLIKYILETKKIIKKIRSNFDFIIINEMPIFHLFFINNYSNICIDWCETYKKGILKTLVSNASKRFTKGIAVSEIVAAAISKTNPNADITVIRTPIDLDNYLVREEEKDHNLILYIGRLVPHKNILSLINAIVYLNEKAKLKKRLVIIGDGPLRQKIIKMTKENDYIEVLGKVSEEKKIELLKKAYLLAIPSKREGFPNVVAEAIAALTPILTVKAELNNVHLFVDKHRIGFISPSSLPEKIAKTIAGIDEEKWRKAVMKEKMLRKEFSEELNIGKLINFIKRC